MGSGFRVEDVFRVQGLGFRVWSLGLTHEGSGFRVEDSLRIQGFGSRVWGLGFTHEPLELRQVPVFLLHLWGSGCGVRVGLMVQGAKFGVKLEVLGFGIRKLGCLGVSAHGVGSSRSRMRVWRLGFGGQR